MNYVSVKGLSKRFKDHLVLDQIDFEIDIKYNRDKLNISHSKQLKLQSKRSHLY